MIEGKKVVVVTPAGRKRYMELLFQCILRDRHIIDEYRIWINTHDKNDISYFESLQTDYPDLVVLDRRFERNTPNNSNINNFFSNCTESNTIYVRLDDDIVYIHPGSIENLVRARIENSDPFILYGNIVNNAVVTHLHQLRGVIDKDAGEVRYDCLDRVGWSNPAFAEYLHRKFLSKAELGVLEDFLMDDHVIDSYARVSINCICWTGEEFSHFGGIVPPGDEEEWLASTKPRSLLRPNMIVGNTLFSHFAFYTQREHLDKTNLLSSYAKLIRL